VTAPDPRALLTQAQRAAAAGDPEACLRQVSAGITALEAAAPDPARDRERAQLRADLLELAGSVLDHVGDYSRAAGAYAAARDLLAGQLPASHLRVLRARYNVAEIYRVAGEPAAALADFEQVLVGLRAAGPDPDDTGLATSLRRLVLKNSAAALLALGRAAEAEPRAAEALGLATGPDETMSLLILQAMVRAARGLPVDADALEAGLATLRAQHGPNTLAVLSAEANVAALLPADQVRRSIPLLEHVTALLSGARSGETAHQLGAALCNLGSARLQVGDDPGALADFVESARVAERVFAGTARVGSALDRDLEPQWAVAGPIIGLLARGAGTVLVDPEQVAVAYRVSAGWKCLQAELVRAQYELALRGRAEVLLTEARARRTGAAGSDATRSAALEAALSVSVEPEVVLGWFERSDPRRIAAELAPGSALVEYVRVAGFGVAADLARDRPELSTFGQSCVLAFVIRPGGSGTQLVRLGPVAPIADAAAALLRSIPGGGGRRIRPARPATGDWRAAAVALAELIWTPLRPALEGCEHVLLAPDGALCGVPFDVLPDGADGAPLLATRTTSVLATGRDLIRLAERSNVGSGPVTIVAAPRYGPPDEPFEPLPGTLREGRRIAELFDTRPVVDAAADRALLLRLRDPEILHVASHGFAAGADAPPGGRAALLHGGVALAGANADPSGAGVLTALDCLGMRLSGTDLVVLSACDTGLGPVDDGEGLLGLARSFFLGGARAVVWSLWKVDDDATADLMGGYYGRLLAELPRARALADAKRDTYRRRPDRPELWAAFASQGDTHPLLRFRFLNVPAAQVVSRPAKLDQAGIGFVDSSRPMGFSEVAFPDRAPLNVANVNLRGLEADRQRAALAAAAATARSGDLGAAADQLRELLATEERSGAALGRVVAAQANSRLAVIEGMRGEHAAAARHAAEAVRRFAALRYWPAEHAVALDNLAVTSWQGGDPDRAIALLEESLALKLAQLPHDAGQIEHTRGNLERMRAHLAGS
jgi:tetratricopeptide (TPR) repeat protein